MNRHLIRVIGAAFLGTFGPSALAMAAPDPTAPQRTPSLRNRGLSLSELGTLGGRRAAARLRPGDVAGGAVAGPSRWAKRSSA
jgi:hypothetical protein